MYVEKTALLRFSIIALICPCLAMGLQCKSGTYISGSSCLNCPSGSISLTNAPSCSLCPLGQSSPPGSSQCYPLVNASLTGSSCRDIASKYGASAVTGWYKISIPSFATQTVYCDMARDSADDTIFPCNNCPSVNQIDTVMPNGCTALGMSMVIPRSQAHWSSMFNFVSETLNSSLADYFQTVPGISKPVGGGTPCIGGGYGIMNYAFCSNITNGWRSSDGGQWWLRDSPYNGPPYHQPDGTYDASCLLGLFGFAQQSVGEGLLESPSNLQFDDGRCEYYSGPFYLCSTNDRNCLPGSSIGNCITKCAGGYYSSTGSSPCSVCPAGTFSQPGATSCSSCPPGSYSIAGSSSCSQCSPGTFSVGGRSGVSYVFSSIGLSFDVTLSDLCLPRQLVASIAECANLCYACSGCKTFIYSTLFTSASFSNQLCILKSDVPQSRVTNDLSLSSHSLSCAACEPGSYSPNNGSSVCLNCPANTYGTAQGEFNQSVACLPCPNGTVSSPGSSSCRNATGSNAPAAASSNVGLIAGAAAAGVLTIAIALGIVVWRLRRRRGRVTRSFSTHAADRVGGKMIIHPSEITKGAQIGAGSYGEVFRGTWNGTEVAIKTYFRSQDLSNSDTLRDFESEVQVLTTIRHPNVLQFFGCVVSGPGLSIVTEFMHRGSLFGILSDQKVEIDPRRRLKMALDIANGMNCLHNSDPPIVHRDLKSSNLLVSRDWTVKVADFGMSRIMKGEFLSTRGEGGTPHWMAPEVLTGAQVTEKSDVFSFGVILFELVTRARPWGHLSLSQQILYQILQGNRIKMPEGVDSEVTELANDCWAEDPIDRPSFASIVSRLSELKQISPPNVESISSDELQSSGAANSSSPKAITSQVQSRTSVPRSHAPTSSTVISIRSQPEVNQDEHFKTFNPFAPSE